mgnify:CR=1|jgi:hypothetical protein|tara:strand:- start:354 stop:539 length:186 start_codon:yes stop_codon:yes gene_type:complete
MYKLMKESDDMRIKGATTVLNKECEFLGLTWDQLMIFIQRNPYAMPIKVIEAYKVYNSEKS